MRERAQRSPVLSGPECSSTTCCSRSASGTWTLARRDWAAAARTSGQERRTAADLARTFGGDVRVEPAPVGRGTTVAVRFVPPEGTP
ncbi:hypothetical protein ACIOG8_20245 [Streptomyces erythrochromogenes]|uniref:hypothetical protein n=1 Tax=Streptomyces erythrochromogenes TaxID=285574 RepID=UPI0038032DD6